MINIKYTSITLLLFGFFSCNETPEKTETLEIPTIENHCEYLEFDLGHNNIRFNKMNLTKKSGEEDYVDLHLNIIDTLYSLDTNYKMCISYYTYDINDSEEHGEEDIIYKGRFINKNVLQIDKSDLGKELFLRIKIYSPISKDRVYLIDDDNGFIFSKEKSVITVELTNYCNYNWK